MNCPSCGSSVPEYAERCQVCGVYLGQSSEIQRPSAHTEAVHTSERKAIVLFVVALLVLVAIGGVMITFIYMDKEKGTVEVTIDNWGWNELNYTLYFNDELKESDFIAGYTEITLSYDLKWNGDHLSVHVVLYYDDYRQDRNLFLRDGLTLGVTFHISDIYPSN